MKQYENSIENFIKYYSENRKLDDRSAKAYRSDLELLYTYIEERGLPFPDRDSARQYLDYLLYEKALCKSTVMRKYRVFSYYLNYLHSQGQFEDSQRFMPPEAVQGEGKTDNLLSRPEVDSFFMALNREYERLDSEFRRRICIRDSAMMKLLFFHGLEVSELLSLKVTDYNRTSGMLTLSPKRGTGICVYLFSSELREIMGRWLDIHSWFERDPEYSGWLFLSKLGRPLSMEMVINIFEKYRVLAGIEKEATPRALQKGMGRYAEEVLIGRCSMDYIEASRLPGIE